jgi:hypothetical protein
LKVGESPELTTIATCQVSAAVLWRPRLALVGFQRNRTDSRSYQKAISGSSSGASVSIGALRRSLGKSQPGAFLFGEIVVACGISRRNEPFRGAQRAGSRELSSDECFHRIIFRYEGSARATPGPARGSSRNIRLDGLGSMLYTPIPHSLRSNSLIRTHDAINGMTLK